MEYRSEYREFDVELTPLELAGRGRDVAEKLGAADKAEQERLDLVAQATERRKEKKGLDAAALASSRVLVAGKERRKQKCEWRPHPTAPRMQLHRLDVPEDASARIVDERQMNKAELKGMFTEDSAPSSSEPASDSAKANGRGKKADKPDAKVLPFDQQADAGGGDDSAADDSGNGHAVAPRAKRGAIACPYVVLEHVLDDPLQDSLCGAEGAARRKGFCEEHYEKTGGRKGDVIQVRMLARRTQRAHLAQEAAEREAELAEAREAETEEQQDDDRPVA